MKHREFNFVPKHEVNLMTLTQYSWLYNKTESYPYKLKQVVPIYDQCALRVSVKNRREFCDYDYLDKLNVEELEWITKFNKEYLNADFKHDNRLHRTKKLKKSCNDMNNARNRCLYALFRVGQLIFLNEGGYP
jgi:hypothetical protein